MSVTTYTNLSANTNSDSGAIIVPAPGCQPDVCVYDRGRPLSLQREELKSKGSIQRIGQVAYYTTQARTVWDRDPSFKQKEAENNRVWEYLFFRNYKTNPPFSRDTKQSPGNKGGFPLLGIKPRFTQGELRERALSMAVKTK